jgi:hypothetical protein
MVLRNAIDIAREILKSLVVFEGLRGRGVSLR